MSAQSRVMSHCDISVGKNCITFFPLSCEACSLYLVLWVCSLTLSLYRRHDVVQPPRQRLLQPPVHRRPPSALQEETVNDGPCGELLVRRALQHLPKNIIQRVSPQNKYRFLNLWAQWPPDGASAGKLTALNKLIRKLWFLCEWVK